MDAIRFHGFRQGVALVLSIETLQIAAQPYPYDEGGSTKGYLFAPHIGLFCSIGAMAVIWFSSIVMLSRNRAIAIGV